MATPDEFQLACPRCDGPGLYMIQDGHRVRTGMTSNLFRFVRRQQAARILYVARLEPCETNRAWRSLLSSLRGLTPKECQYEVGAARDVDMLRQPLGFSTKMLVWRRLAHAKTAERHVLLRISAKPETRL